MLSSSARRAVRRGGLSGSVSNNVLTFQRFSLRNAMCVAGKYCFFYCHKWLDVMTSVAIRPENSGTDNV